MGKGWWFVGMWGHQLLGGVDLDRSHMRVSPACPGSRARKEVLNHLFSPALSLCFVISPQFFSGHGWLTAAVSPHQCVQL